MIFRARSSLLYQHLVFEGHVKTRCVRDVCRLIWTRSRPTGVQADVEEAEVKEGSTAMGKLESE